MCANRILVWNGYITAHNPSSSVMYVQKGQRLQLQQFFVPIQKSCAGWQDKRGSSAMKTNQCRSGGCCTSIFTELKAKANKHLTKRRVQWQKEQRRADTLTFTREDYIGERRWGEDQRETTRRLRSITKIYCVNTVSGTETNRIELMADGPNASCHGRHFKSRRSPRFLSPRCLSGQQI